MNEILTFSIIALILVLSPGPNSVLILKTVSAKGVKASLNNIIGLVFATYLHGAISIFGFSAVILQSAELFMLVKIMGAGYLLYLGIRAIYSAFIVKVNSINAEIIKSNSPMYFHKSFFEGFFTQILNPKVSMFYLAAFPQFISFGDQSYADAFVLVSIHASIIFLWFTVLSLLIYKVKLAARNTKFGHWVQFVSGSVLVYFSALILTQETSR